MRYVAALLLLLAFQAEAVPTAVQHVGRLADETNAALNGEFTLQFDVRDASDALVWTESHTVQVDSGTYRVELASEQTTESVGRAAWLEVSLGGQTLSRSPFHAVPTALVARRVETVVREDCAPGQVLAWSGSEWACANAGVATYVRWGRTTCPTGVSSPVYAGWMLGPHNGHGGGPVEYQCADETPEWSPYARSSDSNGHLFYSVEFENTGHTQMDALVNREVRCAVCEVQASTSLMIPAQTSCPAGWTKQYQGVLAGGYFTHSAQTKVVCMDDNPESWNSATNHDQGRIFSAEIERNSGVPAAYLQDYEPACVVCTR